MVGVFWLADPAGLPGPRKALLPAGVVVVLPGGLPGPLIPLLEGVGGAALAMRCGTSERLTEAPLDSRKRAMTHTSAYDIVRISVY